MAVQRCQAVLRRLLFKATVGAMSLAACSNTTAGIASTDAWARPTPPVGNTAALYVSLENSTATDDRVLSASASVCQEVELHRTVLTGDVSFMPAVDPEAMNIRAGETLTMEPNGLHIMCLGLPAPLIEGEELTLTLTMAEAGEVEITVKVEQR